MDHTKQHGTFAALGLGILCAGLLFASAITDAQARGRGGAMAANSVSAANRSQMSRGSVNRASINTANVNRGNINTGNGCGQNPWTPAPWRRISCAFHDSRSGS